MRSEGELGADFLPGDDTKINFDTGNVHFDSSLTDSWRSLTVSNISSGSVRVAATPPQPLTFIQSDAIGRIV